MQQTRTLMRSRCGLGFILQMLFFYRMKFMSPCFLFDAAPEERFAVAMLRECPPSRVLQPVLGGADGLARPSQL